MAHTGHVSASNELGAALRGWRDRLAPADVGLPDLPGRRARGLRREELAALAGLSVDYIVRLEQGRAAHPSEQVIGALARSLQLEAGERDHLYRLAGLLPPPPGRISRHIAPSIQRLVARLGDLPIAVFCADWSLITWTPLWATLIGDPGTVPAGQRNLVRLTFLGRPEDPVVPVRSERGDQAVEAALVADLRGAQARYPQDQELHRLISDCRSASPRFAELWRSGAVGAHVHDRKTVTHPVVGDVILDCDVLDVPGVDLKVVVYTAAAGSPEAEKLDFLRVGAVRFHDRLLG